MKVLIIRNANNYDFGGAERLAVHLAEELKNNGIDAVVASFHHKIFEYSKSKKIQTVKSPWLKKQNWSGVSTLLLPLYIFWILFLTIWYIQLVVRYKIDVLHIFSRDDFIAGTIAGKILNKKVIWTDCADLKHIFKNNRIWYKNPIGKLVYFVSRFSNSVCLVSESEKRNIIESLGHDIGKNFAVIRIAGKKQIPANLKRGIEDSNSVIFCSTSRLVIDKGIKELIEAFSRIQKPGKDYKLWLIGEGNDRKLFEKQANKNTNIIFFGHVDNPLDYLNLSDIFVQPTYHEGFSLSLTEASMLGKPMIATNVGGNPEIVNSKNGILVALKDIDHLAEAMKKLADNKPLRIKLGKEAKKNYSNFDFSTVVKEKYIPLYEK